jgi:hypothetical protein
VPSLKGVWYRGRYLHDGAVTSLEEMFDAARLDDDFVPTGFRPTRLKEARGQGHEFGLRPDPGGKGQAPRVLRTSDVEVRPHVEPVPRYDRPRPIDSRSHLGGRQGIPATTGLAATCGNNSAPVKKHAPRRIPISSVEICEVLPVTRHARTRW